MRQDRHRIYRLHSNRTTEAFKYLAAGFYGYIERGTDWKGTNMKVKDEIYEAYGEMKPDQDLLAVGFTALLGSAMAAEIGKSTLLERFSTRYVRECQNLYEKWKPSLLLDVFAANEERNVLKNFGAASWYPVGEGGIMAALWHFFDGFGLGFEMDLRKLPIRQETIEVCEVFDLNPYRLQSKGCILMTANSGTKLLGNLEKEGIHAAIIGHTRTAIGREIYSGEVHSFLDRPKPDEIYKMNLQNPIKQEVVK